LSILPQMHSGQIVVKHASHKYIVDLDLSKP